MKNKFIISIVTIAMVFLMAMTTFAADKGWYQNGADWHYADKDGEDITEKWVDKYFLNEDGVMATNTVVEYDGNYYLVNEEGIKQVNAWAFTNYLDTDEDPVWMWFGSNGKAVESGWKNINDTKFLFKDYALVTGFVDANDEIIEDLDPEDEWADAVKYSTLDGMYKGWLKVDADTDDGWAWLYFDTTGKKVTGKKVIDGKTYWFKETGEMQVEWLATGSSITKYYDEGGALLKEGWLYAEADGDDSGEMYWFYAKNGELVKDTIKKINGKWYAFDWEGKMLTGFVMVDFSEKDVCSGHVCSAEDIQSVIGWQIATALGCSCDSYMYFTECDDPMGQGAAVTGKQTLKLACGDYTFNFNKNGVATLASGSSISVEVVKNYVYVGGVLAADEDADYKYEPITVDGVQYIHNCRTGKVAKKGTFTDSDNEIKYILKNGVLTVQHKNADGKWE